MFEINSLDDVRGNNVAIYSIKTLLERKSFPKLAIMSGVMGVGKTSVTKVVAKQLDKSGVPVKTYNFGMAVDMQKIQEEVFSLSPAQPKAFIFEELHGISKNDQNALLQMFDTQAANVYVLCTTTEIQKILRTIRSRAQVWEFKLLSDKQCAQLLDDYLESRGVRLQQPSKQSLLRSCHGVPRDLLKNADFAIEGEFNATQLDALLGNVSDELVFTVFCTLKSNTADFVSHIEELMEEASTSKLSALNDFWLRFLLERNGGARQTLTPEMINSLNSMYSTNDINKVAKMLLRSRPDTVMLELVSLNMAFNESTSSTVLGQQKDSAREAETARRLEAQQGQAAPEGAQLTESSVKHFRL